MNKKILLLLPAALLVFGSTFFKNYLNVCAHMDKNKAIEVAEVAKASKISLEDYTPYVSDNLVVSNGAVLGEKPLTTLFQPDAYVDSILKDMILVPLEDEYILDWTPTEAATEPVKDPIAVRVIEETITLPPPLEVKITKRPSVKRYASKKTYNKPSKSVKKVTPKITKRKRPILDALKKRNKCKRNKCCKKRPTAKFFKNSFPR